MKIVPCPHCGKPVYPAQLLGQLSQGRPKNYTQAEKERRAARLHSRRLAKAQTKAKETDDDLWRP